MRSVLLFPTSLLLILPLWGCQKEGEDPDRVKKFVTAAKCEKDAECAKGFICTDGTCQKGERSPQEIAAAQKAEREAREKAEAAKKATRPGEGRLVVRLCPGFKNTPESIATIVATHRESGKKHFLNLALEVPDGGWSSEFAFYSLPLGDYDVQASYGIQVRGKPDTHALACSPKAKPCKDGKVREMTVVLPEAEPKPELNKEGKPKLKSCDFEAE